MPCARTFKSRGNAIALKIHIVIQVVATKAESVSHRDVGGCPHRFACQLIYLALSPRRYNAERAFF